MGRLVMALFGVVGLAAAVIAVLGLRAARTPPAPAAAATAPPAPAEDEPARVSAVMKAWRDAIVAHDAEAVLSYDRVFLVRAHTFAPALADSARGDPDETVRAFSTRVLGKLADPGLVDVLRALLADPHPPVRGNAAWGLGELRAVALPAAADLERLRERDPSAVVRRAAGEALSKVRGMAGHGENG
jgi:HEAT repeat protein